MTLQQASEATKIPVSTLSDEIQRQRKHESNSEVGNAFIPDHRIKIDDEQKKQIVERVEAGATKTEISKDLDITPQRVGQILKEETQKPEPKEEKLTIEKEDEPKYESTYDRYLHNVAKAIENNSDKFKEKKLSKKDKNEFNMQIIAHYLKTGTLYCKTCGCKELQWTCGHAFE